MRVLPSPVAATPPRSSAGSAGAELSVGGVSDLEGLRRRAEAHGPEAARMMDRLFEGLVIEQQGVRGSGQRYKKGKQGKKDNG